MLLENTPDITNRRSQIEELKRNVNFRLEPIEEQNKGFRDFLWSEIGKFVSLDSCGIYLFEPSNEEENPFLNKALWALKLFFIQKKHILFLSCVAKRDLLLAQKLNFNKPLRTMLKFLQSFKAFRDKLSDTFLGTQLSNKKPKSNAYRIKLPSRKPAYRIKNKIAKNAFRPIKYKSKTSSIKVRKNKKASRNLVTDYLSINNFFSLAKTSQLSRKYNKCFYDKTKMNKSKEMFLFIYFWYQIGKVKCLRKRHIELLKQKKAKIIVKFVRWNKNQSIPEFRAFKLVKPKDQILTHLFLFHNLAYYLVEKRRFDKFVFPKSSDRVDLTHRFVFSIDHGTNNYFEDAFSVSKIGQRSYEIGYHVADVSAFLDINPKCEKYARQRLMSFLYDNTNYNFLPENMTKKISLSTNEDKLALSYITRVHVVDKEDPTKNQVIKSHFTRSIIKPRCCLSFNKDKEGEFDDQTKENLRETLTRLFKLSLGLKVSDESDILKLYDTDPVQSLIQRYRSWVNAKANDIIENSFRRLSSYSVEAKDNSNDNEFSITSPLRYYSNVLHHRIILTNSKNEENPKNSELIKRYFKERRILKITESKRKHDIYSLIEKKNLTDMKKLKDKTIFCKAVLEKITENTLIFKVPVIVSHASILYDRIFQYTLKTKMDVYLSDKNNSVYTGIWNKENSEINIDVPLETENKKICVTFKLKIGEIFYLRITNDEKGTVDIAIKDYED